MTATMKNPPAWRKFIVLIGACALIAGGLGVAQAPMSLWVTPITEALGIPRSLYSTGDTVMKVTGFFVCLIFAAVYQKLGARGCAVIAFAGYVGQYFCLSHATSMALIWVGSFLGGIAYSFTGAVAIFAILPTWFPENAGLVTAIATAVSSIISSRMVVIARGLLADYGYQGAQMRWPIYFLIVYAIAFICLGTHPDDKVGGRNTKAKIAAGEIQSAKIGGLSYYKDVMQTREKMIGLLWYFCVGLIAVPISNMIVPNATARFGSATTVGAAALSAHYLVLVVSKISSGFLRDKFGMKIVSPIYYVFVIATLVALMTMTENNYVWCGYLWGIGANITQIWMPYTLMEAFGKHWDSGYIAAGQGCFQLAWAIGVPLMHIPYDTTGSYAPACIIYIVVGTILFLWGRHIRVKTGPAYQARMAKEEAAAAKTE